VIAPSKLQDRIDAVPVWYHAIDLAPGVTTPGVFDMRPHVAEYGFGSSLAGKKAVDVGASNGFFSFHLEALGAEVVAVDLATVADHDLPRAYRSRGLAGKTAEEMRRIDHDELDAGFEVARDALGSRVTKRRHTVYELGSVMRGEFDLALCSNLLHHLRDPVGGLENIRESLVPGGRMILAFCCDLSHEGSYAIFSGDMSGVNWWTMSRGAALRMCEVAGFEDAKWHGHFEMTTGKGGNDVGTMGVIHAQTAIE